ncbi:COP9 signalosome complex subunit 12 [[Candida] anglica]|uniref:COP9 signalosome complex subunit 12 n=1 Tax=[Candida] anglica TaxID=148631 RepID=A0ABP0E9N2_9ASCO
MSTPLAQYLTNTLGYIRREDGNGFRNCITISPGPSEGTLRAYFPDPSEFDLYPLPEKFRSVIKSYLKLMKSVYILNDVDASFNDINDMMSSLNRAADTQTNWINPALINASTELISVYQVKQKTKPDEKQGESLDIMEMSGMSNSSSSSLEKLASTVNNSFKLSLNDKNPDIRQSKRSDIYFFLGNLIKIYFKLGKLELAKSVEKALKGTRFELPPLNGPIRTKKYAVTYLYYSALLSLDDSDFISTESKLVKAMDIINLYNEPNLIIKQTEKILMILIPLRLYNSKILPHNDIWIRFPNLKYIYKDTLFKAIHRGDLKSFDIYQKKFQLIFLKRHLYLLIENLKSLCYLQLIKKTSLIVTELNKGNTSHIIPLSAYQVALEFSTRHVLNNGSYALPSSTGVTEGGFSHHLDAVECILANLIYTEKIKGYVSHGNKCIVLSKTNAFPNQQ